MNKMWKSKYLIIGITLLLCIPLILSACTTSDNTSSDEPSITDGMGALNAIVNYLNEKYSENVPGEGTTWQETDTTPSGLLGSTTRAYTSGEWITTISFPIVRPDLTVFTVILNNTGSGWHWEGKVKADGTITETSSLKQINQADSQQIAGDFVINSPTFKFDGIEGTLKLIDTVTLRTPFAWAYTFEFQSRYAGYGDRTGQMLAQVITTHTAVITVIHGQIVSATMDAQWNMIEQSPNSESGNN